MGMAPVQGAPKQHVEAFSVNTIASMLVAWRRAIEGVVHCRSVHDWQTQCLLSSRMTGRRSGTVICCTYVYCTMMVAI